MGPTGAPLGTMAEKIPRWPQNGATWLRIGRGGLGGRLDEKEHFL